MSGDGRVIVVGGGMGGLSAAITAADAGLTVTLLEKGSRLGGAAAYSGGQVWVGANHVAARQGIADDPHDVLTYVRSLGARDPSLFDDDRATEWIDGARAAAQAFEEKGVIRWEVIPDYPDYYYPAVEGSKATGRYLTGAPFDGSRLGESRSLLLDAPHFPSGITYGEMFAWGGIASRTEWDHDLLNQRREHDVLTFGQGIAAAFLGAVLDRHIPIMTDTTVTSLRVGDDGIVCGVTIVDRDGVESTRDGRVVLATGAHDWSPELSERFTGIPADDGGSVAPRTLTGDAIRLGTAVGAEVVALPAWAAPVLPGYVLPMPLFPGDSGARGCYEHCMPHAIVVDTTGSRFCDDSFHPALVEAGLTRDASGTFEHLPMFLVWDEEHHRRYGLGPSLPGQPYPEGLVSTAPTLESLARALGIDPQGFAGAVAHFNAGAADGQDPDYGRGSNLSVRKFRGDANHPISPNVAPLLKAPFHGLRLRLLNTGIAAAGLRTGAAGRVMRADGSEVVGLHAVGESATRLAAGLGYNSGYSLSRAMTYGRLAALDIAAQRDRMMA
jgi:3-oxosteroid 1-dehydrogenase